MHDDVELFLDTALKAKLGAVKTSTLAAFNDIIDSHKTGKKAANLTVSANVVKSKGDKGKSRQQSGNSSGMGWSGGPG